MQERMEKIFSLSLGVLLALSMIYVAHSAAVFVSGRNVEGRRTETVPGSRYAWLWMPVTGEMIPAR